MGKQETKQVRIQDSQQVKRLSNNVNQQHQEPIPIPTNPIQQHPQRLNERLQQLLRPEHAKRQPTSIHILPAQPINHLH